MIFALEFSDNVDPTALATVLLALLTFATVVVGGLALRRSRSEIDLSRREVEEAHRPVLIPVFEEDYELLESGKVRTYSAKPRYENDRVVVPIKNIGSGPALNITLGVAPVSDTTQEPAKLRWYSSSRLLGLGVKEMAAMEVYMPRLAELPDLAVMLTYLDVAEKPWITSADYRRREGGAYVTMRIRQGARDGTVGGHQRGRVCRFLYEGPSHTRGDPPTHI